MDKVRKVMALDIETVPMPMGDIPAKNIEYLLEKSKAKRTQKILDLQERERKDPVVIHGPGSISMSEMNQIVCIVMRDQAEYDIAFWVDLDRIDEKTINLLDQFEDKHEAICRWDTEKEMLNHILKFIQANNKIITFNGNSFDLRHIMMRSHLNDIKRVPIPFSIKPWDEKYFDVRTALAGQYGIGDLPYWCRVFGIKEPQWQIEKGRIRELWQQGEMRDIIMGCREDVRVTWELGARLLGMD